MLDRRFLLSGGAVTALFAAAPIKAASQKMTSHPVVRIAELKIDPAQLDAYRAALKEEIAASISVEPGVLTLLAVSVKDQPNQIRIFETYADRAAYEAHLQTSHFKKYKSETQGMVKSLTLIETDPILLAAKSDKPYALGVTGRWIANWSKQTCLRKKERPSRSDRLTDGCAATAN
jgi:quinol monooxygenase YgiN